MDKFKIEFHCHTIYSKDSLQKPQALVDAARKKGLNRVIVTDHNSVAGGRACHEIAPELIIVGEEVMTTCGELLAAFVSEEVPAGLQPAEAIHRLRAQGAFISVSHPFDPHRGWELSELLKIIPYVDAIEIFNARCMSMKPNHEAAEFARQHGLRGTVGSDAHASFELGRAALVLDDFSDAQGLKHALDGAHQQVEISSPLVHLASRYATTVKQLGLVRRPGRF